MKECFGHDGATGVSAWVDKQREIAFVILTNRGHPDISNNLYTKYKGLITDAIIETVSKWLFLHILWYIWIMFWFLIWN